MENNNFTGSHLPANANVNNGVTNECIGLNTVETEIIKSSEFCQNHQFEKNLLQ